MAIRAQSKPHQPVMLRFEDGVAPNRGGPPLGSWQEWLPSQPSTEATFPKPIIAQGLAAYQRGKVRSLNLRRADSVATVADTETHTTTLTRDTSRPPLGMRCNCTCRYGYDCKHAVAALYMLLELREQQDESDAAAQVAPNGQTQATNGHATAAPATPSPQNGNGAATAAAPPSPAPTAAKSPAGSPAFVEFLDLLTPHHEAVVPRRRLWIVVGYDELLGVFHARLCLDAPKLHGVARTH